MFHKNAIPETFSKRGNKSPSRPLDIFLYHKVSKERKIYCFLERKTFRWSFCPVWFNGCQPVRRATGTGRYTASTWAANLLLKRKICFIFLLIYVDVIGNYWIVSLGIFTYGKKCSGKYFIMVVCSGDFYIHLNFFFLLIYWDIIRNCQMISLGIFTYYLKLSGV